jgi:argininosuccinate lyase
MEQLMLLLPAVTGMVATLTLRPEVLEAAAPQGFALATDVAEWLVSNGVPFRSAHEISGAMVAVCEEAGLELDQLDDDQLAGIDERLTPAVRSVLSVPGALAARRARGGTAPERVAEQLAALKALATAHSDWASSSPVAAAL